MIPHPVDYAELFVLVSNTRWEEERGKIKGGALASQQRCKMSASFARSLVLWLVAYISGGRQLEVTPTTSTPANFEWMGNRKEGRKEAEGREEGLCLRLYAVRLALRGGGGGGEERREEKRRRGRK